MKKIAIMILLNMAALGASAQVMEREATGSPRFCQEFQTTYDGVEKINPTIQFVYDRFNEALSTAGMPQLVLKSCQRTKIKAMMIRYEAPTKIHFKVTIISESDLPRLNRPLARLSVVTCQKIGIVIDQTTMHHGQSAPIT